MFQVDAGIVFASPKEPPTGNNFMFDIRTPSRVYYLQCQTEAEMNKWVDCLCQVCGLKAQTDDNTATNPIVYPPPANIAASQQHLQSPGMMPDELSALSNSVSRAESNMYISGPYIPISECITGRKVSSNNRNQNGVENHNSPNDNRRLSIPSEMAPPAPLGASSHTSPASSTSTLVASNISLSHNGWANHGNKPGDAATLPHPNANGRNQIHHPVEHSRSLRGDQYGRRPNRSLGSNSEDGSVRSPPGTGGSSSSVCTDDDRSSATPHSNQVFFSNSENPGSTAFEGNMTAHAIRTLVRDPNKVTDGSPPPRPPKPARLEVPQQCYMNIDSLVLSSNSRKNSIAESAPPRISTSASVTSHDGNFVSSSDAEPSPASAASSLPSVNTPADAEAAGGSTTSKRYMYPGGAPSSVTSDRVFSYDSVPVISGDSDPRISPALYTNLSSINNSIGGITKAPCPPTVNRGLKPKISSSDGSSLSGCDTSPCIETPSGAAPTVDRNLKPLSKGSSASEAAGHGVAVVSPEFVLDPAPRSRPKMGDQTRQSTASRTGPSPTLPSPHHMALDDLEPPPSAHSWRNSAMPEEQVRYYFNHVLMHKPPLCSKCHWRLIKT